MSGYKEDHVRDIVLAVNDMITLAREGLATDPVAYAILVRSHLAYAEGLLLGLCEFLKSPEAK
jgi:hypothetical protein